MNLFKICILVDLFGRIVMYDHVILDKKSKSKSRIKDSDSASKRFTDIAPYNVFDWLEFSRGKATLSSNKSG